MTILKKNVSDFDFYKCFCISKFSVNSDQEFESLLKEHERQLDEEERAKEERKKERAAARKAKESKQKVKRRKEEGEGGEDGDNPQVF